MLAMGLTNALRHSIFSFISVGYPIRLSTFQNAEDKEHGTINLPVVCDCATRSFAVVEGRSQMAGVLERSSQESVRD